MHACNLYVHDEPCNRFYTWSVINITYLISGGEIRPGRGMMNFEFTFDLFVSAAILVQYRDKICSAKDAASVYGCLNRWGQDRSVCVGVCGCVWVCVCVSVEMVRLDHSMVFLWHVHVHTHTHTHSRCMYMYMYIVSYTCRVYYVHFLSSYICIPPLQSLHEHEPVICPRPGSKALSQVL